MVNEKTHENEISDKESEGTCSYCEPAYIIHNETKTPKRALNRATSMDSTVGGGGVYNTPNVVSQIYM